MVSKNILIVDDAAETRIFLKGLINSLGYTSFEAKNGMDAIKITAEQSIDLVILDVLMPNFDGFQTLEAIRKQSRDTPIKIVFLTGKKGEINPEKVAELKPDDFIQKSVDIHVLKTKLKKLIGGDDSAKSTAPPPPPAAETPPPPPAKAATQPNPAPQTATKPATPPAATGPKPMDLPATVTNMPIELEIRITKLMQSSLIFYSKVQFKEGAELSINCPPAANALKKTGELKAKVQKCVAENDKFNVTALFI